jgi:hypothetical protein
MTAHNSYRDLMAPILEYGSDCGVVNSEGLERFIKIGKPVLGKQPLDYFYRTRTSWFLLLRLKLS